jgi:hypothetical protein
MLIYLGQFLKSIKNKDFSRFKLFLAHSEKLKVIIILGI